MLSELAGLEAAVPWPDCSLLLCSRAPRLTVDAGLSAERKLDFVADLPSTDPAADCAAALFFKRVKATSAVVSEGVASSSDFTACAVASAAEVEDPPKAWSKAALSAEVTALVVRVELVSVLLALVDPGRALLNASSDPNCEPVPAHTRICWPDDS